jgi:hypothetical protein
LESIRIHPVKIRTKWSFSSATFFLSLLTGGKPEDETHKDLELMNLHLSWKSIWVINCGIQSLKYYSKTACLWGHWRSLKMMISWNFERFQMIDTNQCHLLRTVNLALKTTELTELTDLRSYLHISLLYGEISNAR